MLNRTLILIFCLCSMLQCQESLQELKSQSTQQCTDPTHKHYPLLNMGYITPWKKVGYEMIEKYYNKFDIVSPTWFELVPEVMNNEFNVKIDGANNVDMKYLKEIKSKNEKIKIMPRFHCGTMNPKEFALMFNEENSKKFIKILMRRIKHNKFDGIVLDCIQLWMGEESYLSFEKFLPKLSEELHKSKLNIVITLFPYSEHVKNEVDKNRFEFLAKHIDYFNIMTYDYLQYHKNTPQEDKENKIFNAPLNWIKQSIEYYVDERNENKDKLLKQILLGLPFHGYALSKKEKEKGGVLDSEKFNAYVDKVKEKNSLLWNEDECEHLLEIKEGESQYVAVYPTRKFLKERLELTKSLGLGGCAIWDVGNGNDNFMDEF